MWSLIQLKNKSKAIFSSKLLKKSRKKTMVNVGGLDITCEIIKKTDNIIDLQTGLMSSPEVFKKTYVLLEQKNYDFESNSQYSRNEVVEDLSADYIHPIFAPSRMSSSESYCQTKDANDNDVENHIHEEELNSQYSTNEMTLEGLSDDSIQDPTFSPSEISSSEESNYQAKDTTNDNDVGHFTDVEEERNCQLENTNVESVKNVENRSDVQVTESYERNIMNNNICAMDLRKVKIDVSKKNSKKYFCSFCKKLISNFGRHLVTVHKNVYEVSSIIKIPKGHPLRHAKIAELRKKAQFAHNTNSDLNTGVLIVKRRPVENKARGVEHFKMCPKCGEMFSKLSLRCHISKCSKSGSPNYKDNQKVLTNLHPNACKRLIQEVFQKLRDNPSVNCLLFDELCISYGNKLCVKYRNYHQGILIRQRMRDLGKFIYEFNKIDQQNSLRDILSPQNYNTIVQVINNIAGLNASEGKYRAPSTAYNLGLLIKDVTTHLEVECIKIQDNEKKKHVKDLLILMNESFSIDINKTVSENQSEIKRHKKITLPTAEDISALQHFLSNGIISASRILEKGHNYKAWRDLAGYLLISLQLFNRRRAGELERILIEDFAKFEYVDKEDVALQDLDDNIKQVAQGYGRFMIRGKLNRTVPVIMRREIHERLKMILKLRSSYGVPKENPYVFGIPARTNHGHLRACNLIRTYSHMCGAPHPYTLRGTELRKQIATACALYNLPDPLVEDIANHLGHHIDIHKKIYRQSTARELPAVTKILLRALGEEDDPNIVEEEMNDVSLECSQNNNNDINFDGYDNVSYSEHSQNNQIRAGNSDTSDKHADSDVASEPDSSMITTRVKSKRKSWTTPEKQAVQEKFTHLIKYGIVPSYEECEDLRKQYSCLQQRTPPMIKSYVVYQSKKSNQAANKNPKKLSWTTPEKHIVRKELKSFFDNKSLPPLSLCKKIIDSYPILNKRTPAMLKAYVNNVNKKK